MTIVEKKIVINLESGTMPSVDIIENAIIKAGLEPVRWAIVDKDKNSLTILANGVEKA